MTIYSEVMNNVSTTQEYRDSNDVSRTRNLQHRSLHSKPNQNNLARSLNCLDI
jgi:hypothetical protein